MQKACGKYTEKGAVIGCKKRNITESCSVFCGEYSYSDSAALLLVELGTTIALMCTFI